MNYPKIKLIFSIYGDLLDSQAFSKLVDQDPTDHWVKGDIVKNRKINILRKETAWEYEIDYIVTWDLDEVAELFLHKFSPYVDIIANYIEINELMSKFDFVIEMTEEAKPSCYFFKNFIDFTAKIGAEIGISLYVFDSDPNS